MITKFKLFEVQADKVAPNFNVGDKVVCINDEGMKNRIENGKVYTIRSVDCLSGGYFCSINGEKQFYPVSFSCNRFIPEIEYNANKYNL